MLRDYFAAEPVPDLRLRRSSYPLVVHAGSPAKQIRFALKTMPTVLLLICSNIFMTFAWYGHLKYGHAWPLWKAIVISWLIALVEYCFAVPANRWGFGRFNGFQLKIIQEAVTLTVFVVFAVTFLKEQIRWNYVASFFFLLAAVVFAFAFNPTGSSSTSLSSSVEVTKSGQ